MGLNYRLPIYDAKMMANFATKTAEDIFNGENSRKARKLPVELHDKARRLMDQLDAAPSLEFMRVPPGNMFEPLQGDMKGKYSVRINKQWRVVFEWHDNMVCEVDVMDYHRG